MIVMLAPGRGMQAALAHHGVSVLESLCRHAVWGAPSLAGVHKVHHAKSAFRLLATCGLLRALRGFARGGSSLFASRLWGSICVGQLGTGCLRH
ncbi:hypothetical protein AAFF_G00072090 [Aldrovandia affinis]|uniref:Uncharacterized protein n=1 Tax=Aldrovandia affinis TaxID=143900 RepID=A0AAD7RYM9_9TELE|nr:hypothetical protein AAFF_G00072090 [Aldrovandia affinis]